MQNNFEVAIDKVKHNGLDSILRKNTLSNITVLEELMFHTDIHCLCEQNESLDDRIAEFILDGGTSRIY